MLSRQQKFFIWYWAGCLLFTGIYMYVDKRDDYVRSEKATAVVIDRLEARGRRGVVYFYPQFQFTYHDSNYISADRLTYVRRKKVGDKLTVIFPKGQPGDAIAYTFVSYWIYLPVLLIFLMIFIFIYAVIRFLSWKKNAPSAQERHRRFN